MKMFYLVSLHISVGIDQPIQWCTLLRVQRLQQHSLASVQYVTIPIIRAITRHKMTSNISSSWGWQLAFQTTHTVFETELLKQLTAQLTFSAYTFESQAEVYNSLHGYSDQQRLSNFVSNFSRGSIHDRVDRQDWRLNVTRLEDGWFMHRLVSTFAELGILQDQNFACYTAGNRRDRIVLSESYVEDLQMGTTSFQCAWLQRGNGNNWWKWKDKSHVRCTNIQGDLSCKPY